MCCRSFMFPTNYAATQAIGELSVSKSVGLTTNICFLLLEHENQQLVSPVFNFLFVLQ